MNLDRALSDIAQIRAQLDRAEAYRGFRSLTVGMSAIFVVIGGCVQRFWIEYPEQQPLLFLKIWVAVAIFSALACTIEMLLRNRISGNSLTEKLHRSLICRTLPSIFAGFVVTVAAISVESEREMFIKLLPGLWAMFYGLGLWACGSALPRLAHVATIYFLVAGAMALLMSVGAAASHPSQMVFLFAVGQTLLAAILFWKVERVSLTQG